MCIKLVLPNKGERDQFFIFKKQIFPKFFVAINFCNSIQKFLQPRGEDDSIKRQQNKVRLPSSSQKGTSYLT